jgi:hypothetical protein
LPVVAYDTNIVLLLGPTTLWGGYIVVLYTLSLSPLHPSSRIFDGLKRRDFKTNNLLFYNWFFVKYFLIEQIVLDVVRCYSNNQYQAGITTQFYYNKTEIELKAYEVILKSGSTQPIYFSLVPPRIDALQRRQCD